MRSPQSRLEEAEKALAELDLVFVYGTLKRGFGNNTLLRHADGAEFIREDYTNDNHVMFGMGVPFVRPANPDELGKWSGRVSGELWRVKNPMTLARLDNLEGHPTSYTRTKIVLSDGETIAWIYYFFHSQRNFSLAHYSPAFIEPKEGVISYD